MKIGLPLAVLGLGLAFYLVWYRRPKRVWFIAEEALTLPHRFSLKHNLTKRNWEPGSIPSFNEVAPPKETRYIIFGLRLISSAIGNQEKVEALHEFARMCESENKTLIILYYHHKDLPTNYAGMTKHEIYVPCEEFRRNDVVFSNPNALLDGLSKIIHF